MAAATIRAWVSPRAGPRCGSSCRPQAIARACGSPVPVVSAMCSMFSAPARGGVADSTVCETYCVCHTQYIAYTDLPLIQLRGLHKGFGGHEVLKCLGLPLPPADPCPHAPL